jgi:hypothetical protein
MIREELNSLPTGRKELRNFGLLVGGIFSILGIWYPFLLAIGATLLLLGFIVPTILCRPYLAWMTLALVMGLIVSTILLTLFYFLVMTPIGWAARLAGKDFMQRKLEKEAMTYWTPRRTTGRPRSYENQY